MFLALMRANLISWEVVILIISSIRVGSALGDLNISDLRALSMHKSVYGSQDSHVSRRSIVLPLAIHYSSNPLTCMSM